MQVELKLDPQCGETRVTVTAAAMTDEVAALMEQLSRPAAREIAGFAGDVLELLRPEDIIRVYTENQRVAAQTAGGVYTVRARLYDLEARLASERFVRISNSEIINLRMVKSMDLSISGTIAVSLRGGVTTYASRRYVPKIREMLGI